MAESNPVDMLVRLSGAQCVSRALHVVADLGIADALGDRPTPAATLAAVTGTHTDALERVLRLLCGYRIFATQDGMFAHTPASQLLRSDHPQSLRSFVRMMGLPIYWRMWETFSVSVKTGAAAAAQVLPEGIRVEPPATHSAMAEETSMSTDQGMRMARGFSLLVAILIIANTFLINVTQRRKQMGIMRAIGATKKQIKNSLLAEALIRRAAEAYGWPKIGPLED